MVKWIIPLLALVALSGCCKYIGMCTSVQYHGALDSPNQVAQQLGCANDLAQK